MVEDRITIQMVGALRARYEAQRQSALAELMVYLRNPAGVGEHSSLLDTCSNLISKIADADGAIETLDKHFIVAGPGEVNQESTQ